MRYSDGKRVALYGAVGDAIRERRRGNGMSLRDVAEETGFAKSMLDKIEQGVTPCPLHVLVALADLFDATLDELVPVQVDA